MSDERDWTPEHLAALKQTTRELWPTAPESEVDLLVSGLTRVVGRARLRPSDVFSGLIATAESGRVVLPSVGAIMQHVGRRRALREGQQSSSERKQIEPRVHGQPWAPALWTAAFVQAGGPARLAALPSALVERMQPWLDLVRELRLRPTHGIDTHPEHDAQRVANANARALDVWREHGGISASAALKAMAGRP